MVLQWEAQKTHLREKKSGRFNAYYTSKNRRKQNSENRIKLGLNQIQSRLIKQIQSNLAIVCVTVLRSYFQSKAHINPTGNNTFLWSWWYSLLSEAITSLTILHLWQDSSTPTHSPEDSELKSIVILSFAFTNDILSFISTSQRSIFFTSHTTVCHFFLTVHFK